MGVFLFLLGLGEAHAEGTSAFSKEPDTVGLWQFSEGEGELVALLVNGVIDAQKEMESALVPFSGTVIIGRASGENYHFNGIIGEVSVLELGRSSEHPPPVML